MSDAPSEQPPEPRPWERRHAFRALDAAVLAEYMRSVLGARRIISALPLTAGYVNTNYHVRAEGLDAGFVLRLYAGSPDVCAREVALLRLVRERGGVPVPEVLHADTEGARHGVPYAVLTFVEGILLRDLLARTDGGAIVEAAHSVGATLASIASVTFPDAGFLGPDLAITYPFPEGAPAAYRAHVWVCLGQDRVRERLGEALAAGVKALVEESAGYANEEGAGARSLVHGDYKPINLLVRPDNRGQWRVSGVLDWEFAHVATPLLDLAILFRDRNTLPPAFMPSVARGFTEAGGSLPADWPRVTRLIDLVNLCDFLTVPGDRGAMTAAVRALISDTVQELGGAAGETRGDDAAHA